MRLILKKETLINILCFVLIPVFGFFPTADIVLIFTLVILFVWENDYYTMLFFVIFSFIQNIVLTIGANSFGNVGTTLFSLSKEIMIYGCVAVSVIKNHKIARNTVPFFVFLFVALIEFTFSDAAVYAKILSIRQLFLPFICFFFGFTVIIDKIEIKKICKVIVNCAIISAILGLIEIFILKDSIWHTLPIHQYEVNKGTAFSFYNDVPLNFYTWDYYDFTHLVIRRLVSVFVDPLITGHYLFLGFVLTDAAMMASKIKTAVKSLLLVSALLTLSKGVYIGFIIYFSFKAIKNKNYKNIIQYFWLTLGSLILAVALFYIFVSRYMMTSSILIHFNGLFSGFKNMNFFGNGLGKAGVITSKLSGIEASFAGESYLGILAGQMGLIGLISFILFFVMVILKLIKKYKYDNIKECYDAAILLTSVILESFFSESSIGIVGTGFYFVFAGIMLRSNTLYKDSSIFKDTNKCSYISCNRQINKITKKI